VHSDLGGGTLRDAFGLHADDLGDRLADVRAARNTEVVVNLFFFSLPRAPKGTGACRRIVFLDPRNNKFTVR
jgi:hypothetical protein